ncbi:MAG: hypothetical protein V4490_07800 [Pseudomonadota bacterium]
MFVNDRQHTDTLGCRLSPKRYRGEAEVSVRKETDNSMYKGCLSRREEDGLGYGSEVAPTHHPSDRSI